MRWRAPTRAFLEPVEAAQARLAELQLRQREGIGELRGLSDDDRRDRGRRAALHRALPPRAAPTTHGPAPLRCAARWVESALAGAAGAAARAMARANAVLLLAAALDGHAADRGARRRRRCCRAGERAGRRARAASLGASLGRGASLMADARQSLLERAQERGDARAAARRPAGSGPARCCSASCCSRGAGARVAPALGVAAALALWALAAWAGARAVAASPAAAASSRRALERALVASPPAAFVLGARRGALACCACCGRRAPAPRARAGAAGDELAHRLRRPGAGHRPRLAAAARPVGATATRATATSRCTTRATCGSACCVFSVLLFLRQPLARALAWTLSVAGETARGARAAPRRAARARARRRWPRSARVVALGAGAVEPAPADVGARPRLADRRRRLVLLPARRAAGRAAGARRPAAAPRCCAMSWPLLFVVAVLVGAMLVTRDMGPLLIAGYARGRLPRRVGRDVVAPAQRRAARRRSRWRRCCSRSGSSRRR